MNFIVGIVRLFAGAAAVFCVVVTISWLRLSQLPMFASLIPSSQNHGNTCCCSHARRVASHMFSSQSSIVRAQWELLQVSKSARKREIRSMHWFSFAAQVHVTEVRDSLPLLHHLVHNFYGISKVFPKSAGKGAFKVNNKIATSQRTKLAHANIKLHRPKRALSRHKTNHPTSDNLQF